MHDLIISLAVNGRENYESMVTDLVESISKSPWQGKTEIWTSYPDGIRPHSKEAPYYFKYDLIEEARQRGYKRIFWLDASMRLLPDRNILDLLENNRSGVVAFHNLGHDLSPYINDTAMDNFQINRFNLEGVHQTWGGALGFDFTKWPAQYIFASIQQHIKMGSFLEDNTDREGFIAHRHDQAILSWLLYEYGIPLLPYGVIAAKNDISPETYIQYGN